ncbi:hypothetical protein [Zavarzinia sp. CC-PAN008]|uniref:hypothetical protein n=1 Tax=Zavarzinia sp. CC-PAN008 TaxID=3243332 RepID=UPI003F745E12
MASVGMSVPGSIATGLEQREHEVGGHHADLDALGQRFAASATALAQAVEAFGQRRGLPVEVLGEQLIALARDFRNLRQRIAVSARALEVEVPQAGDGDLETLRQCVVRLDEAVAMRRHRARLDQAARIVARVLDLVHVDRGDFPALSSLQDSARLILGRIEDDRAEVLELDALISGEHSLVTLLRVIEERDTLHEDTLDEMLEAVRTSYGSRLATAAVLGKLKANSSVEAAAPPAPPPEPEPEPEPPVMLAPEPEPEAVPEPEAPALADEDLIPAPVLERAITARLSASPLFTADTPPDDEGADAPTRRVIRVKRPRSLEPEAETPLPPPAPIQAARAEPEPAATSLVPHPLEQIESIDDGDALARCRAFDDGLWRAASEGRWGLAFHLAVARDELPPLDRPFLPLDALVLAAAAPLADASGQHDMVLKPYASRLNRWGQRLVAADDRTLEGRAVALVALVASLVPAFGARDSGAADTVATLKAAAHGFPDTVRLAESILAASAMPMALASGNVAALEGHRGWSIQLAAFAAHANEWLERERNAEITTTIPQAAAVWLEWLKQDGPIGRVLRLVAEDQRAGRQRVQNALRNWDSNTFFELTLINTDRALRGRAAERAPIEGRARTYLIEKFTEARKLVGDWLAQLDAEPAPDASDTQVREGQGRDNVRRLQAVADDLAEAIEECRRFEQQGHPAASAARAAARLLRQLAELLVPGTRRVTGPSSLTMALNGDLLIQEEFRLGPDWSFTPRENNTPDQLLQLAEQPVPEWPEVFRARAELGDHVGTQHVLDWCGACGLMRADQIEALAEERQDGIEACAAELDELLTGLADQIDAAKAQRLISDGEAQQMHGQIRALVPAEVVDFPTAEQQLVAIAERLMTARRERAGGLAERVRESDLERREPEAFRRIQAAVGQGHLTLAEDLFGRADRGKALPAAAAVAEVPPSLGAFDRFFPGFAEGLGPVLTPDNPRSNIMGFRWMVDSLALGHAAGPLDLEALPPERRSDALELLELWLSASEMGEGVTSDLTALLQGLGFVNPRLSGGKRRRISQDGEWDLKTAPVPDRDTRGVDAFGSRAQGRYRLAVLWQRRSPDGIVEAIRRMGDGDPVIALFFGCLTPRQWRRIAAQASLHDERFLVLDEAMLSFLAAEPQPRLRALFDCALPFTTPDLFSGAIGVAASAAE